MDAIGAFVVAQNQLATGCADLGLHQVSRRARVQQKNRPC
jgi:hypothetical protein